MHLSLMKGLIHRLRHNPDVLHKYDVVIKGQLAQGIVERVEDLPDIPGVYTTSLTTWSSPEARQP